MEWWLALLCFAHCYLLIDILGYQRWTLPFKIFGMNALFAFIFHVVLIKLQFAWRFPLHGGTGNVKEVLTDYFFASFTPANASLLYSLSFLMLNFIVVTILYQKKIFLRV